jgi:hypothetical protein
MEETKKTNKTIKVYVTACYYSDYAGHEMLIDLNCPENEMIAQIVQELGKCGCIAPQYREQVAREAIEKAKQELAKREAFEKLQQEFLQWKGNRTTVYYISCEGCGRKKITGGEGGLLPKQIWLRAKDFKNVQAIPKQFKEFANCYNDEFVYTFKGLYYCGC